MLKGLCKKKDQESNVSKGEGGGGGRRGGGKGSSREEAQGG